MTQVTKKQARTRYTILSPALQDAIFSEQTANILDQIAIQNALSDDRSEGIASAVALVLLGFIHPEDLAKEIQDRTGVDSKIAGTLSLSIENKILAPIHEELTKAYDPPSKFDAGIPKVIDIGGITGGERKPFSAPTAPSAPTPSPSPAKFGSPSASGTPQIKDESPAPVIIHEEPGAKPLSPGFRINMPTPKIDVKAPAPAPKPAVLELGNQPVKPAPKPEEPKARIVHYTDLRTPLAQAPGGPTPLNGQTPSAPPSPAKTSPQSFGGQPKPATPSAPTPPTTPPTQSGNSVSSSRIAPGNFGGSQVSSLNIPPKPVSPGGFQKSAPSSPITPPSIPLRFTPAPPATPPLGGFAKPNIPPPPSSPPVFSPMSQPTPLPPKNFSNMGPAAAPPSPPQINQPPKPTSPPLSNTNNLPQARPQSPPSQSNPPTNNPQNQKPNDMIDINPLK